MDERELKKEYVMYLRDNKLEHLDCEMLFEMIKYFEGLGKNKYDEALERARRILCNVPEGSASARDIETIFPELRESEDERMVRKIESFLSAYGSDYFSNDEWREIEVWLEKQKGQKPAEWSEEDSEMIMRIINQVGGYTYFAGMDSERVVNWLKSLRPQPHWKPSEEQMSAFKGYIENFQARAEAAVGGWNNFDIMIRLYEQLKKLM